MLWGSWTRKDSEIERAGARLQGVGGGIGRGQMEEKGERVRNRKLKEGPDVGVYPITPGPS